MLSILVNRQMIWLLACCALTAIGAMVVDLPSVKADGPDVPPTSSLIDIARQPAPSSPAGSRAPLQADGKPAAQAESKPPLRTSSAGIRPMGLIPVGTSRPPAGWASTYLVMNNGGMCYSKVTQYDIGSFPLFTHDLHTWAAFSPGSYLSVYDEWIQKDTWYGWNLQSNTEGHYLLDYDTIESWANSAYSSSAPSPFFFYHAWPYMRNRISWFGQCRSDNSSLDFEEFMGLQHIWWRGTYQ